VIDAARQDVRAGAGRLRRDDRRRGPQADVADLEAAGFLGTVKKHKVPRGRSQRSGAVVEPMLMEQWFVKTEPLAKPAIAAVESGKTKFVPELWTKTYMHWMTNIKDWCISRQLWWGHRIPAWYCGACSHITVSRTDADGLRGCGGAALRQDDDILDTWFSSALWPFSTLGWPDKSRDLTTFYPNAVLVTGPDIIFFWVARMMMMGLHFMGKVPFRTVYLTSIVTDENGDKMSKTKGNVIDPLDVVHGATPRADRRAHRGRHRRSQEARGRAQEQPQELRQGRAADGRRRAAVHAGRAQHLGPLHPAVDRARRGLPQLHQQAVERVAVRADEPRRPRRRRLREPAR
jgi:valyl-tRNA synthetase